MIQKPGVLITKFGFILMLVLSVAASSQVQAEEAAANKSLASEPAPSPSPVPSPVSSPSLSQDSTAFQKWTGKKGAVSIGMSPVFRPRIAGSDRLGIGNLVDFDLLAELPTLNTFGLRYAHTTIPSLQVYNPTAFTTSYVPNAPFTLFEFFAGVNLPLNEPYASLGPVQLFIPVQLGLAMASISGSSNTFLGLAADFAAGMGARLYTSSFFRADISALYRIGIPIENISSTDLKVVQDPAGETMKLGLNGFELRLGVSFIFPDTPGEAQK